jgi:hypothetical protein
MRTAKYWLAAGLTLGLLTCTVGTRAEDGDTPKHTIKEVMKIAHNGKTGLAKKVISGQASDAEKKELAELYADLGKSTPPKGSPEGWKEKTGAVAKAAKDVEAGKPGAAQELQRAINCMGCHRMYK